MKSQPILASALAAQIALSGCAGFGSGEAGKDAEGKPLIPKTFSPAVIAFTNNCPIENTKAPQEAVFVVLAAALASAAISSFVPVATDAVVHGVADWLETRASKLNSSTTGSTRADLYKIDDQKIVPQYGCLIFMRGEFNVSSDAVPVRNTRESMTPEMTKQWSGDDTRKVNVSLELANHTARLVGYPELYDLAPVQRLP